MPTILATLIPALIQAGVQLVPLLEGLLATRSQLQQSNPSRPDVDDATMAAIETAIQTVQAKIDAAASGATT